ncbi:MAG: hypothetical protein AB7Q97_12755 [Gammaproteobacteria bacterium]
MHWHDTLNIAALALALGAVHAFDADHIAAVSALASRAEPGQDPAVLSRRGIAYAIRWALGHGTVLVAAALAAAALRLRLPEAVSQIAERAVGIVLIATGIALLWSLRVQRIGLHAHRHGSVSHLHLARSIRHDHAPVLVGLLHGLAGSAPMLAVIPVALWRPAAAAAYVLVFSAGVMAGMVAFGAALGRIQCAVAVRSPRSLAAFRLLLAGCTVGLGLAWLTR